ncbi:TIGR02710 family CRISPR-associated CARF protein [uncultured Methanobrevibacter sp.]|uniref:TIGR02710 family CRISPR-associated CARF protein n=1 Tax=uncultured Methanobrevibacter sp. TaxID=253161 RepID=UPI0025CBC26B|nr:TIGR02710 family CRISPR-associated CARF protein [uncultured Methanobrevibacter sp.]
MLALILSCGGSPEPLIFSIKNLKPDYIYFLCSNDSKNEVSDIIEKSDFSKEKYSIKIVNDYESLDDCFAKSREIIKELEKDYDNIHIDFTGGTKPMVTGLVLAAIGEECSYSYVGTEDLEGRDKNGLGIVQDGFEKIKEQKDPYDIFAVMEFEKGMDFFNRYQFGAAYTNFDEASQKLESESLKELTYLYLNFVEVYSKWDKFYNKTDDGRILISKFIKIRNNINNSSNIQNYLNDNYPNFISQINENIEFLRLKLSRKGHIKPGDIPYYLADLLNNAHRRIEEDKYDDAVARLYRSIELIAQLKLCDYGVIDENILFSNSEFKINKLSLSNLENIEANEFVNKCSSYHKSGKNFPLASKNSYKLLSKFGCELASEYLDDDDIDNNIKKRNSSILAHGLKPIDETKANELYSQVFEYAKKAFPEVEKYMEMAKFPKFIND